MTDRSIAQAGWVFGQLPDGDEEVARAERRTVDVACGDLALSAAVV